MEHPVKAVYEKDKIPEPDRPVLFMGMNLPIRTVYMGVAAVAVFLLFIVMMLLPSGIPYLAVKQSNGFFEYIGLFFVYMLGFFAIAVAFFIAMAFMGIRIQQRIDRKE